MRLAQRDSDQRLVQRARRGDEEAFERLYMRYRPRIFAYCRHLTGQREDAEDALQYTFLAAYREIAESDRRLDVRPWLFAVARNRCLDLLRARRLRTLDEAPEPTTDSVADLVERRQALRDIVRDLGDLPEQQRSALLLSELGALSHGDVATVLDVPPAKVKALVFQARRSLLSTREARDTSCEEIREQLATLTGASLRRRLLRRHLSECGGCREFEAAVAEQRRGIAALLPPALLVGGRGAATALTAAGSGAGAGGLSAGGGVAGSLMAIGTQGAVTVAVAAAVLGGGTAAVVASDLPQRVGIGPRESTARAQAPAGVKEIALQTPGASGGVHVEPGGGAAAAESAADGDGPRENGEAADRSAHGDAEADGPGAKGPGRPREGAVSADASGEGKRNEVPPGRAHEDGVPPGRSEGSPGQAKRDEVPGQAKRNEVPGQARNGGVPPGQAKKAGGTGATPPGQQRKGAANGSVPPGQAKRQEAADQSPGQAKRQQAAAQSPGQAKREQATTQPPGQSKQDGETAAVPPGQAKKAETAPPASEPAAGAPAAETPSNDNGKANGVGNGGGNGASNGGGRGKSSP